MFDIGTQELIIIFIVALLVFGPKKLPELARTLGRGVRELKAAMMGVKESIEEVEAEVTKEIHEGISENIPKGDLFDFQDKKWEDPYPGKGSGGVKEAGNGEKDTVAGDKDG